MTGADNTCEVCGGSPILGVCSSVLGPISHAYCERCHTAGAEPYGTLVATLYCINGLENMRADLLPVVEATLRITGKTTEQLAADVAKALLEDPLP